MSVRIEGRVELVVEVDEHIQVRITMPDVELAQALVPQIRVVDDRIKLTEKGYVDTVQQGVAGAMEAGGREKTPDVVVEPTSANITVNLPSSEEVKGRVTPEVKAALDTLPYPEDDKGLKAVQLRCSSVLGPEEVTKICTEVAGTARAVDIDRQVYMALLSALGRAVLAQRKVEAA